MYFPLRSDFAAFNKCWYVMFPLSFVSKYFISPLTHQLFRRVLFHFHLYMSFPVFLLLFLVYVLPFLVLPLWSEKIIGMILVFFNLLRLEVFWLPNTWCSLKMFRVHLGRMCTLLLTDKMFCICLLGPFGL